MDRLIYAHTYCVHSGRKSCKSIRCDAIMTGSACECADVKTEGMCLLRFYFTEQSVNDHNPQGDGTNPSRVLKWPFFSVNEDFIFLVLKHILPRFLISFCYKLVIPLHIFRITSISMGCRPRILWLLWAWMRSLWTWEQHATLLSLVKPNQNYLDVF